MELPVVKRLQKELETLRHELTFRIPQELEEARSHGDLSENAEYDAAKTRQEFLRTRIGQIEGRIRELSLYTVSSIPRDVVAYGSRVTVEDLEDGERHEYRIVFPEEVDPAAGCISLGSPLGSALCGKSVGDEVEVHTPRGKKYYQIVGLITLHDASAEDED